LLNVIYRLQKNDLGIIAKFYLQIAKNDLRIAKCYLGIAKYDLEIAKLYLQIAKQEGPEGPGSLT